MTIKDFGEAARQKFFLTIHLCFLFLQEELYYLKINNCGETYSHPLMMYFNILSSLMFCILYILCVAFGCSHVKVCYSTIGCEGMILA